MQPKTLYQAGNLNLGILSAMREVDKVELGRRVARRREARGMSQKALGEAVGLSQQGIDNIEHGSTKRPRAILEMALALWTTAEWLLWEEGPEEVRPLVTREDIFALVQELEESALIRAYQALHELPKKRA